jgi:Spy/CpxP family protein refolding chaperone
MSTRKVMTSVAAAALALGGWVAMAQAQGPGSPAPHDRGYGRGFAGPRLAEALGLSDDQKAQLDALRSKQRETMRPLMEAVRQAHDALKKSMDADSPDPATVGQAALTLNAAEKKLRAAHEAAFEEMKSILTPEQQAKLEQMKEKGPRRDPGGPRF